MTTNIKDAQATARSIAAAAATFTAASPFSTTTNHHHHMPSSETERVPLTTHGRGDAAREEERGMLLKAFACVLMAAATAAGCTAFVSRRRASHGLAGPVQLSEASRWVYRRVSDLSGRGAERHDPHMAARISHARQRARNQRARKERQRERARENM